MKTQTTQSEKRGIPIPSLVKQGAYSNEERYSERFQKNIENPNDTGLTEIVETVFSAREDLAYVPMDERNDAVLEDQLQKYALNVVEDLEFDPIVIKKRQEIAKAFRRNPELVDAVKTKVNVNERKKWARLDDYQDACESLASYVSGVKIALEEASEPSLEEFALALRQYETDYMTGLQAKIKETRKPAKSLVIHLSRERGSKEMVITTDTGRTYSTENYTTIYSITGEETIRKRINELREKVKSSEEYTGEFDLVYRPEESPSLHNREPVRFRLFKKSSKKKDRGIIERLRSKLPFGDSGNNQEFEEVTSRWNFNYLYNNVAGGLVFGDDAKEKEKFEGTIKELRYFATLAEKLPELAEKAGVPLTTPEIVPVEEGRIEASDMYDPLLVSQGKQDIVPNDISISKDKRVFCSHRPKRRSKNKLCKFYSKHNIHCPSRLGRLRRKRDNQSKRQSFNKNSSATRSFSQGIKISNRISRNNSLV